MNSLILYFLQFIFFYLHFIYTLFTYFFSIGGASFNFLIKTIGLRQIAFMQWCPTSLLLKEKITMSIEITTNLNFGTYLFDEFDKFDSVVAERKSHSWITGGWSFSEFNAGWHCIVVHRWVLYVRSFFLKSQITQQRKPEQKFVDIFLVVEI